MSASVIASALLAAVNLSISKPSDYRFVSIPDEMANSLTGVGLKEDDEGKLPLRYEDAAFLTEAYAERYSMMDSGATNGNKSVGRRLARPTDYYALAFVGGTNAVTLIEPYGYAVTNGTTLLADIAAYNAANSTYAYDAIIPILGTGGVPFPKPSIDLTSADWTNKVLSAKNVAALYADLGKFSRAYETCNVLPANLTSNEYITVWSKDYTNMGEWKTSVNPDGWGYGVATNGDSVSSGAKAYDLRYSRKFRVTKKISRGWDFEKGDSESKWVDETGAVLFTATETSESYSRVQGVITSSRFKPCGDRKYGAASLYAYGTLSCKRSYTSSYFSTGFVIKLAPLKFDGGKAETDFAFSYSDVASIADRALTLVQHQVVFSSADDLLSVLPSPETPSSDHSNYSDTYTEDTFTADVWIDKFFVVVDDIKFNARVSDGE